MTGILALAGALILAGAAAFTFLGGYWWQYWRQIKTVRDQPSRQHWMEGDDE